MINILADFACHETVKLGDDMQYAHKSGREIFFFVYFFPCCKMGKKLNGMNIMST